MESLTLNPKTNDTILIQLVRDDAVDVVAPSPGQSKPLRETDGTEVAPISVEHVPRGSTEPFVGNRL